MHLIILNMSINIVPFPWFEWTYLEFNKDENFDRFGEFLEREKKKERNR